MHPFRGLRSFFVHAERAELCRRSTPEEERARAAWDAPWALLVVDDSGRSVLEYANRKVGQALGASDGRL